MTSGPSSTDCAKMLFSVHLRGYGERKQRLTDAALRNASTKSFGEDSNLIIEETD